MNQPPRPPRHELLRRKAAFERQLQHHIATTGWAVMQSWYTGAEDDNVPISYTIGLTEHDLPELCIVGINPDTSQSFLNSLARRATANGAFQHGQRIGDLAEGLDMVIVDGPATGLIQPTIALHYFGPDRVRLQQCVWPDPDGRFPWEPGYSMPPVMQPTIAAST